MKSIAGFVLFTFVAFTASPVSANPSFSHAESGSITIDENGAAYDIYSTDRAIGAFHSFSNAPGETIRSIQASADHTALFRVTGGSPSEILGSMSANSRVFLVNPNGILFGPGSSVNAPGLVASSLPLSSADFLSGNYMFGSGGASVVNRGSIEAGSYAVLLGNTVSNEGSITAPGGAVALAAGGSARILLDAAGLVSVEVTGPSAAAVESAVLSNSGTISADGGYVLLTARAAESAFDRVVNHTGAIEANSVGMKNGVVVLDGGSSGVVAVAGAGTISAAGADAGETGGTVKVLGDKTGLFDSGSIDVSGSAGGGEVFVGGGFQGRDPELANASYGFAGSETSVKADAIDSGDGGLVVFWADRTMNFQGVVSARGGSAGGDGGFVEVSGKEALGFSGFVDARAPLGEWGTLLLDPKNITIDDSGASASLSQTFISNPAGDVTIDRDTINAAASNVDLQANNDILLAAGSDISMTNSGISLSLRAGRSVELNSSITTTSGAITIVANESTSNGVVNANRDAGAAVIRMAAGTALSTSSGADIVIKLNTGSGLTNSTSGDITLANITASGNDVHVQNYGPTAGGDILRASSTSLITAGTTALETTSSGGAVGTAAAPIRLSVAQFEALADSGGIHLRAITGSTAGGAMIGSLTGLTTTGTGDISVTSDGVLAFSEAVDSGGDVSFVSAGNMTFVDTPASNDVEAGGDITMNMTSSSEADILSIPAGAVIFGRTGTHTYKVINISLQGTIDATGRTVYVLPNDPTDGISLGSSDDATADQLELSASEVPKIIADKIVFGSASGGDIYIEADITATGKDVEMLTAGTIRDDDDSGPFVTDALYLTAGTGIGGGAGLALQVDADTIEAETDSGGIHLDIQDAQNDGIILDYASADSGNITIESTAGTPVKTIDTLLASAGDISVTDTTGSGITHTGTMTASGDISLTHSTGDILLDLLIAGDDVTVSAGGDILDNNAGSLNVIADALTLSGSTVGTSADPIEARYNTLSLTPAGGFVTYVPPLVDDGADGLDLVGGRIVGGENIEDLVTSLYGEEEGAGETDDSEESEEEENAAAQTAEAAGTQDAQEAPEPEDVPALDEKTFQPCGA